MFIQNNIILVSDVMILPGQFPVVKKSTMFKEALEEMENYCLGITCIVDNENKLCGILTDGDIRRNLLKIQKPFSAFFVDDSFDHAIRSPVTVKPDQTLEFAVKNMEEKQVWDLPVVDTFGMLVGLLHLHPAVKALLEKE
jgi:CBS domain-containing protein